jgi:hypothetical protein
MQMVDIGDLLFLSLVFIVQTKRLSKCFLCIFSVFINLQAVILRFNKPNLDNPILKMIAENDI